MKASFQKLDLDNLPLLCVVLANAMPFNLMGCIYRNERRDQKGEVRAFAAPPNRGRTLQDTF